MNNFNNHEMLWAALPGDDQSEGLQTIPAGTYPARVADVEGSQTAKGGFMWKVTLEIADGQYQGRKLFYNCNWTDGEGKISGGIGFAQMFLRACGVPHVSATGQPAQANVSKGDLIGKLVLAVVSIQQGGQYAGRNQTDRIDSYSQAGAPAFPGAAPAGPPMTAGGPPMATPAPTATPAAAWAPTPSAPPVAAGVPMAPPTVAGAPAYAAPSGPPGVQF